MPDYRCYPITLSGSIGGPAQIIDCTDDVSAIEKAKEILPTQPFEIWQGARTVYPTNGSRKNTRSRGHDQSS
jgi:hypothetical protein